MPISPSLQRAPTETPSVRHYTVHVDGVTHETFIAHPPGLQRDERDLFLDRSFGQWLMWAFPDAADEGRISRIVFTDEQTDPEADSSLQAEARHSVPMATQSAMQAQAEVA